MDYSKGSAPFLSVPGVTPSVLQRLAGVAPDELRALGREVERIVQLAVTAMALADQWEAIAEIEACKRRLDAAQARLLGDFDARDGAQSLEAARSTAAMLQTHLHISRPEANARVKIARHCFGIEPLVPGGERRTDLPLVTQAWLAGDISEAHARMVNSLVRVLDRDIQGWVPGEERDPRYALVEGLALKVTQGQTPQESRLLLAAMREHLVPECIPDKEGEAYASRRLSIYDALDGMKIVDGRVTAELGSLLEQAIKHYESVHGADADDPREPTQKRHDGLLCLLRVLFDEDEEIPAVATDLGDRFAPRPGQIAHISVLVQMEKLRGEGGAAPSFLDGAPIDNVTVGKLACDADIEEFVLEGGRIIGQSRARVASGSLRRLIFVRDRGSCRFPGCRAAIRNIHHQKPWAEGGLTHSSNLIGLCWLHHDYIHHEGWELTGDPDLGPLIAMRPITATSSWRGRNRKRSRTSP